MSAVRSTSPYGTRSRNRTTAPRVNYAEDKDDHMDFEYTSPSPAPAKASNKKDKEEASSKKEAAGEPEPTTNNVTAASTRSAPVLTRRASYAQQQQQQTAAAAAAAASAVTTNGTTTSAPTQATTTNSRKRKSTAGGATASNASANTTASAASAAAAAASALPATHVTPAPSKTSAHTIDRTKERAKLREEISNMLTFDRHRGTYLNKDGHLKADNGTILKPNDHLYLVCEPPGEPYYLARIMEFIHANNDPKGPIDSIKVNWYYRPKDVQRKVADTRVIFATMHSDKCPLSSIRGVCTIVHRSEIEKLDAYRKQKDSFYFDKMYDRYIHRYYDVIPTKQVLNVPEKIRNALTDRWKYILVEPTRAKELTAKMKVCKRCSGFAGRDDSVSCSLCDNTYHMNCVRPPLLKKPSRGFAWACAPCSRDQERKLEARNTPLQMLSNSGTATGTATPVEEDFMDEDDEEMSQAPNISSEGNTLDANGGANTPNSVRSTIEETQQPTKEQLNNIAQWPYRYFGIHCKMEDALDYDDRIYPRAASRIGPRHQCIVVPWYGRPVEFVKPTEAKKQRRDRRDRRRDGEAKEEVKEKPGKWVQDMPPGYIARGEDDSTATLLFKLPEEDGADDERGSEATVTRHTAKLHLSHAEHEEIIDKYLDKAKPIAKSNIGVEPNTTNYLDKAMNLLWKNSFDMDLALKQLKSVDKKKDLKEPEFKGEELKRFEEGVAMFGSELHSVAKHVRTRKEADIVRFYYIWKKTERGKEIWGNYDGRKSKKEAKSKDKDKDRSEASTGPKLIDDFADDLDDSAFDDEKAEQKKKGFQCKFCKTKTSVQWRRAPGVAPGTTLKDGKPTRSQPDHENIVSLCRRCGELWRKYAIQWEDLEEAAKKLAQGSAPKQGRRRVDEDLLREITIVNEENSALQEKVKPLREALVASKAAEEAAEAAAVAAAAVSANAASSSSLTNGTSEPPRKRSKGLQDPPEPPSAKATPPAQAVSKSSTPAEPVDIKPAVSTTAAASPADKTATTTTPNSRSRKKEKVEKPEPSRPKLSPCAICEEVSPGGSEHLVCRDCKLTVHRACYGVGEIRRANKWVCDMCANDKNPVVSTDYTCVLCPVRGEGEIEEEARLRAASNNTNSRSRGNKDKEKPEEEKGKEKDVKEKEKEKEPDPSQTPTPPDKDESKKRGDADKGRPQHPRQPLKQTTGNNWVHVTCAIWTPEIRFGNAKALIPVEGIGSIPITKFSQVCSVCNVGNKGSCISCHTCHQPVHVGCARKAGWTFGFDVQPVKSSRRDVVNIVTVGNETGNMQAAVWCKNHDLKTPVHAMNEKLEDADGSQIALQLYVNNYKQADLTLTGTVRKAQLVNMSTKASQQSRRASLIPGQVVSSASSQHGRHSTSSPSGHILAEDRHREASPFTLGGSRVKIRRCQMCGVDVSPLWHQAPRQPSAGLISGGMAIDIPGKISERQYFMDEDMWYCHRCDHKHKTGQEEPKYKLKHPLTIGGIIHEPLQTNNNISPVKTVLHQLDPRDPQQQQQQQPSSQQPPQPQPSQHTPVSQAPAVHAPPPHHIQPQQQQPPSIQPHIQPQAAYHDRPPVHQPPVQVPPVQHPVHQQSHHQPHHQPPQHQLPQMHHALPQHPAHYHPLHPPPPPPPQVHQHQEQPHSRMQQPHTYPPPPPHHLQTSQPKPHEPRQYSPTKPSHPSISAYSHQSPSPHHAYHPPLHSSHPPPPPPPPSHPAPVPPPPPSHHYQAPPPPLNPQRTPPTHHIPLHSGAGSHRSPTRPTAGSILQPPTGSRHHTPVGASASPPYGHHSPPRPHDTQLPVSQPVTPHAHRVYATPEPRQPPAGGHGASGSPALANLLHP